MNKKIKYPLIIVAILIVILLLLKLVDYLDMKKNRLLISKYESVSIGMNLNKVTKFFGSPDYIIKLSSGKIYYYEGPDGFANAKNFEKNSKKIINISDVRDIYGYFEFYFNEKDILEAYTYYGKAFYIKSIYGNIKGSSMKHYLEEKKFKELKLLLNNEENIKKIYGIPKCVTNIKNLGKIYFYAPYPINIYQEIKSTEGNKINELENLSFYYAFFFNNKGELEAKESKSENNTIFGKYNLFWFIKLKIKKAKE